MTSAELIPAERIRQAIILLRGQKVMLDRDLAALYGAPTKALKQAVKRNADRFPDDFMFVLDTQEVATLRSQSVTSKWREEGGDWRCQIGTSKTDPRGGARYAPMAFAGSTRNASAEMKGLFEGTKTFETPKPEKLVQRILDISTDPGDIVLDSFAGSGTTGAVAHKMGRRWIMVELGEHCHTHIIPRLKKVIDGEDSGGITEAVGWKGGGGFRYYRLAPSLLEKDKWGNWIVNKQYNAAMLAEAICKLEGFTYAPSDSIYWQHGHSSERDFIYVTTQNLNHEQLQALSDEVGGDRSLLVLCSAFRGKPDRYPSLTIKKIPNAVLKRCEWGRDDYSLQVENLPKAPPKPGQQEFGLE